MWNKFKEIISQYLSIEESRKSIVVMVLIGITIIGLYKAYYGIDIPNNVMSIIITLSGYVFGINMGNQISGMYNSYAIGRNSGTNVEVPMTNPIDENDSHINGSL